MTMRMHGNDDEYSWRRLTLIGVQKEIENHEYRVGLTPASARELTRHGHLVPVQRSAGTAIGLPYVPAEDVLR